MQKFDQLFISRGGKSGSRTCTNDAKHTICDKVKYNRPTLDRLVRGLRPTSRHEMSWSEDLDDYTTASDESEDSHKDNCADNPTPTHRKSGNKYVCRCGSFCSKNDYVFDRQSQPCQIKFTPSICKVESDPGNGLWWHLDCVRVVCMMNVRDENCVYKIGFSCVVAL